MSTAVAQFVTEDSFTTAVKKELVVTFRENASSDWQACSNLLALSSVVIKCKQQFKSHTSGIFGEKLGLSVLFQDHIV